MKIRQEAKFNHKMKHFILLIVFVSFSILSFGQVMPETFMGMAPKIPANACTRDIDKLREFNNEVDSLLELVEKERERRNEEMEANSERQEQLVIKKMAQQFGLSEKELKKLQDEELSDEESDALVDKALQSNNNLSLAEIENLDKLNSDGQMAWANAYGTEKMAEVQYDPQKNWEQQLRYKNLYVLTNLQKHLLDSLAAIESKFNQQLAEIECDTEAKAMLENIKKWELRAIELMGDSGNSEAVALHEKINAEKEKYCNKYSMQYLTILERYETYTKSSLAVYYKIESISSRQIELQTGVDMQQEPGLAGIGKVTKYLQLLRGAYKYNLFQN